MVCGLELAPVLAISVHGVSGHIAQVQFIADDYLKKPSTTKIQALLPRSAQREASFAAPYFDGG